MKNIGKIIVIATMCLLMLTQAVNAEERQYTGNWSMESVYVTRALNPLSAVVSRADGSEYIIDTQFDLNLFNWVGKNIFIKSPGGYFGGFGATVILPNGVVSPVYDAIRITAPNSSAVKPLQIFVNNELLTFDVQPIIQDGVTLVPMRKIVEKLGAEIQYDKGIIQVQKGANKITLKVGEKEARVNDKMVELDVPAKEVTGRTLIPLRFVSESFNAEVNFNQQENVIIIATQ